VVVSDCQSLRGDIVFTAVLVRQSPAAKIPFQTRTGQVDRKGARVSELEEGRLIARMRGASSGR
jgi:hypothetical protein